MHDVGQSRQETNTQRSAVKARSTSANAINDEREDSEEGDRVTVEILREGIVITVKKKLKKGWRRSDKNGGNERDITLSFFMRSHYRFEGGH